MLHKARNDIIIHMKRYLIISIIAALILALLAAFNMLESKPEREILIEENYTPPPRNAVTPAADDLTPMP